MLTMDSLTKVAALCSALPGLQAVLTGESGATVTVGDHPRGALCPAGLRMLLSSWDAPDEPRVDTVTFAGASLRHGMLVRDGECAFAVALEADAVARCLRIRGEWPEAAHAVLWSDERMRVTVVRVLSSELDDVEIEDLALEALATCAVEELISSVS